MLAAGGPDALKTGATKNARRPSQITGQMNDVHPDFFRDNARGVNAVIFLHPLDRCNQFCADETNTDG